MAARLAREREASAPPEPDPTDRWAVARREAGAIEPGHIGTLRWIDMRCQMAGMHALDAWWVDDLRGFYASGKMVHPVRVGLRGAKSSTFCEALVNDGLFGLCDTGPETVLVIPIMSSDRTEATDRFFTIRAVLAACGVGSDKDDDPGGVKADGLDMIYTSSTLPSGGGVIKVTDSQRHAVQFRIYPARITGAVGYTAKSGLCDEVDLWPADLGVDPNDVARQSDKGKANPADVVLDRLMERFTTTFTTAHLYVASASYKGNDSAHARRIDRGDKGVQYVARLRALGAARDTAARRRLAASIGSTDPRLLAEADPLSTNIPAWVSSPVAPIETCYALSDMRIGPMLGRYGGCPDEAEGRGPFADVVFVQAGDGSNAPFDTVTGIAPDGASWAAVSVSIGADATLVVNGMVDALIAWERSSVLAVHTPNEARARGEIAALVAGAEHLSYPPPLAPASIYDGPALRVAPLLTLYARGRIRHAAGLEPLEGALRGYVEGVPAPRVEALVAAIMRLLACYPWLAVGGGEEFIRGPAPTGGMHDGVGERGLDMARRLGAR